MKRMSTSRPIAPTCRRVPRISLPSTGISAWTWRSSRRTAKTCTASSFATWRRRTRTPSWMRSVRTSATRCGSSRPSARAGEFRGIRHATCDDLDVPAGDHRGAPRPRTWDPGVVNSRWPTDRREEGTCLNGDRMTECKGLKNPPGQSKLVVGDCGAPKGGRASSARDRTLGASTGSSARFIALKGTMGA